MKPTITLFGPPHSPIARRTLRFSEAALAGGHEIVRLFFYQDGVHSTSTNAVSGQDELDLPAAWRGSVERSGLDIMVYITTTLRRGVLNAEKAERYGRPGANPGVPWELSGLDQLYKAVQNTDHLACSGGDR